MPDTFFRTFLYGVATVAVGAGVAILAGEFVAGGSPEQANAAASVSPVAERVPAQAAQPEWKSDFDASVQAVKPVGANTYLQTRAPLSEGKTRPLQQLAVAAAYAEPVPEPVISFSKDAVEFTVPVDPRSGRQATMPVALALAIDPVGLPEDVREAAQEMAMDFLDSMQETAAAVAADPQNPLYYRRWEDAAFLSDHNFKMRYGRVAYVQMNMLAAQEAAAVR